MFDILSKLLAQFFIKKDPPLVVSSPKGTVDEEGKSPGIGGRLQSDREHPEWDIQYNQHLIEWQRSAHWQLDQWCREANQKADQFAEDSRRSTEQFREEAAKRKWD